MFVCRCLFLSAYVWRAWFCLTGPAVISLVSLLLCVICTILCKQFSSYLSHIKWGCNLPVRGAVWVGEAAYRHSNQQPRSWHEACKHHIKQHQWRRLTKGDTKPLVALVRWWKTTQQFYTLNLFLKNRALVLGLSVFERGSTSGVPRSKYCISCVPRCPLHVYQLCPELSTPNMTSCIPRLVRNCISCIERYGCTKYPTIGRFLHNFIVLYFIHNYVHTYRIVEWRQQHSCYIMLRSKV
jgi:hypothetical protein